MDRKGENETWRREARRCRTSASQTQRPEEQRMLSGFARFYEDLADSEIDASSDRLAPPAAPDGGQRNDTDGADRTR